MKGEAVFNYLSCVEKPNSGSQYKILVISDYRAVSSSRPEAEIFIRLAQLGHEIHVISHAEAIYYNARFQSNGMKVFENPPRSKISLSFTRYLRSLVHEHQYDFVHAFNSKGLTNAAWGLIGLKPKLIAYRGYAGQTHWYDPMMYLKYFHPRVDKIICVSKDIENILAANMISGRHKLITIPKGHAPEWYKDINPIDRKVIGFQDDAVLVSFLANVRPFKGIKYLLRATHLLRQDLPIHFLFIGRGHDNLKVRRQMEQSPWKSKFHILGYRNDAMAIVAASDCLIQTSTHGEGLSKSVVEAMSLGVVPIITDIPGNQGLLEDGQSGWIVRPKDPHAISSALEDMAKDKTERTRRSKNAKEYIFTHFHIDQTVEKFVEMYRGML